MTRIRKYHAILCPFAELNVVHSYAGQFLLWAEPCGYMPFLCSHFQKIMVMQAGLWSDWWTGLCHDSLPLKWGWSFLIRMLGVQSHPPLKLTSGTPTLSPEPIVCPRNDWLILPPPHHANKKGNSYWEIETLEGWELPGGTLEGWELPGGLQSFLVTHTSLGVTKLLFGL